MKKIFIAKEGHTLVHCDLSQGEFRAWASYANDQKMLNDIAHGFDVHRWTAAQTWGIPEEQVTKDQRTGAKRVVFGLMYGMGVELACQISGLPAGKVRKVIDVFFGRYPKAKTWLDLIVLKAKREKTLVNVFGRKRRFIGFESPIDDVRALCERQAKNFLMQSTTADITDFAMVRLHKILSPYKAQLVLTVHDCIVYEVPDENVEAVKEIVQREVMRPIKGYLAKIDIELKAGKYWE